MAASNTDISKILGITRQFISEDLLIKLLERLVNEVGNASRNSSLRLTLSRLLILARKFK